MAASNQQYDFAIRDSANTYGFMLARDPAHKGRAWVRTGVSDSLSSQRRRYASLFQDEEYGGLPDELDHPEVQDDWSGGYGDYRRLKGRENHYHIAFNFDTRFPRVLFHAQAPRMLPARYASSNTNVDYFLDVPLHGVSNPPAGSGEVLILAGKALQTLTPTNLPYTAGSAFDAANITSGQSFGHRPAVFASYVYAPNLDGSGFLQYGAASYLATYSDCMTARWFQVANGRLWRGYGRGVVQSCAVTADPLVTANWSATLNLGNGNLVSDDAESFEKGMFVGFPDGLYQGDATGTFSNVLTDLGDIVDLDAIRDIAVHNGQLVVAAGRNVWGYKPPSGNSSELRQLWPTIDAQPNATWVSVNFGFPATGFRVAPRGKITCLKGFGRWLYAGVFNGSQSMVYCGVDASAPLPYVWHPMQLFAETCKISRIHVDGITTASDGTGIPRRIWVATDATFGAQTGCTAPVYWWPIPANDEQPLADPSFSPNYCTQAFIEHGLNDWQSPGTWKLFRKVEIQSDTLGSPVAFPAFTMELDGSIQSTFAASLLGTFGGVRITTTPHFTGYFSNASNTAIAQAGRSMLYSVLASGPTPIYRSIVVRGSERPRSVDTITAKVKIADGLRDRQGGQLRDGQAMLNELRMFALSSNPYLLQDLVGATLPVVILPPIEEQEVYQGGSDYPEVVATVKIGVLDATWTGIAVVHPLGG